ncbi:DUF5131 family protein [Nocardiopsis terrae]|uniref:DUF5131 family protein n=1 Tax=Streptomyces sp. NPDC057554 TaxID=3350538 RepID=UPI0036B6BD84
MSRIEWTSRTWNPVTGCDRVSAGCDHCYALTLSKRLKSMGAAKYQSDGRPETSGPGFGVVTHPEVLAEPYRWEQPQLVFVNSMSDLFHPKVPDGFIARVWQVMAQNPHHTFQVLTKRPKRMRAWVRRWADTVGDRARDGDSLPPMPSGPQQVRDAYSSGRARLFADALEDMGAPPTGAAYPYYDWMEGPRFWPEVLPHVWLGVSVEDQQSADERLPLLCQTPAEVRFVSAEPLIGPIRLHRGHAACPAHDFPGGSCSDTCPYLITLDWLIIGGESGPRAKIRPLEEEWVRSLITQGSGAGMAVFVKQLGALWARAHRLRGKGGDPSQWPEELRVREYPKQAQGWGR